MPMESLGRTTDTKIYKSRSFIYFYSLLELVNDENVLKD